MKKFPHVTFGSQLSEEQVRELKNLENWLEGVEHELEASEAVRIAYDLDRQDIKDARKLVLEEMRRRGQMGR